MALPAVVMPQRLPFRARVGAYVALTKPRIIELLLITTLPTMIVAQRGLPPVWLMVATLLGGALAAGGANAINMVVDRDIDKLMHRTRKRPLVTGVITPRNALIFAIALEVVAFVELWAWVNLLSAALAVSATLFYVFVYTLWLKRTSSQNIVIGGAAGAVPVLVGWAAVTDSLSWTPVVLFAIIFVWTPPHFWALAVKYKDDYQAASVPMLPAVATFKRTAREILFYSVVLVGGVAAAGRGGQARCHLHRVGVGAGRVLRPLGGATVATGHAQGGDAAVQLLDHLSDLALRADGGRHLHQALIETTPDPGTPEPADPADQAGAADQADAAAQADPADPADPADRRPNRSGRPNRPGRPNRCDIGPTGDLGRRPRGSFPADGSAVPARAPSETAAGVPDRPVIAAVLAVALFVGLRPKSGSGSDSGPVVGIGSTAPDFTLPALTNGAAVNLDSLGKSRHHPVVLNFFASWCGPCRQETPLLARTAEAERAKGSNIQFVGVDTLDPRSSALPFVQRAGITYPVVTDDGQVSSGLYGVYGDPQTFFIDADGKVIGHAIGALKPAVLSQWLHRLGGATG